MFSILIQVTGAGIAPIPNLVDSWKPDSYWSVMQKKDPYTYVMSRNAEEGIRFMKPLAGHEDGCVMGICKERASALGDDGVLHTPMHKPVSRLAGSA